MTITARMTRGSDGRRLIFFDCDLADRSSATIAGEAETPEFNPALAKQLIELGDLAASASTTKRALAWFLKWAFDVRYGRMIAIYVGRQFIETMVNRNFFRIVSAHDNYGTVSYYINSTRYRNFGKMKSILLTKPGRK